MGKSFQQVTEAVGMKYPTVRYIASIARTSAKRSTQAIGIPEIMPP